MTREQEQECIKIADRMYRLKRYAKVPWAKVVEDAMALYRAGVRFED